jgi:2-polyprenyl-3-methyl-5-hydroxy-6-metoxy-1,4-benzoquinol methylase
VTAGLAFGAPPAGYYLVTQSLFAETVLQRRRVPAPAAKQYLSIEDAEEILEETIDWAGRHEDAMTYKYLVAHRKRLVETLVQIPRASKPDAACIDVGCFGYMAFWAWRHLGYARVEGIEFRSDIPAAETLRKMKVWHAEFELTTHNFDLSTPEWPALDTFDTILFFETLEHINSDPMRVMLNLTQMMAEDGCLVMSVPNAISYKTLQEFIAGMPPWNYWFYHSDCFEYTPFVFEALLTATGLEIEDLRSLLSFQRRETLDGVFAIGKALSLAPEMFGDTLLARAHKVAGAEIVRYPDCIYDSDRYYKSTYPYVRPIMDAAVNHFLNEHADRPTWGQMDAAKDEVAALQILLSEREAEHLTIRNEVVALHEALEDSRRDLAVAQRDLEDTQRDLEGILRERDAQPSQAQPRRTTFRLAARLELEIAKLLCTLGMRSTGTALWNRAKVRLA